MNQRRTLSGPLPSYVAYILYGVAALVSVLLIALIAYLIRLDSSSSSAATDNDSRSGPFTTMGEIADENCNLPLQGQVAISDSSGTVLAVGQYSEERPIEGTCMYTFTVANIPDGESFYQMSIAGRDTPYWSENELRDGIALTLG